MWPFDILKKKKELLAKRKKHKIIILCSVIGGVAVCGSGVAVGVVLLNKKNRIININETTILNYKISAGTQIFVDGEDSVRPRASTFCHDLLNLKALSNDNKNITKFIVTQDIDFGFLVDPDMDCHLSAEPDVIVNCFGLPNQSGLTCGVVVGKTKKNDGIFKGKMEIDSSMTFNISAVHQDDDFIIKNIAGVLFYSNSNKSVIKINGTFKITGGDYGYGVAFRSNILGNLTMSGTFFISAIDKSCGFYCNGDAQKDSVQTINGTFSINADEEAYGVCFNSALDKSIQTIDGSFSIRSFNTCAILLYFFTSTKSGSLQKITGIFTINSNEGDAEVIKPGEYSFNGEVELNNITINFGDSLRPSIGSFSNEGEKVTMNQVKVFSKNAEFNCIWTSAPSWNGTYQWNGTTMTQNQHSSDGDNELTLSLINDTSDRMNYNFYILVLGKATSSRKQTFNTAYKNCLSDYINNVDCPITSKAWLSLIIPKIPLS